jgi:hypothetical protein
LDSRIETYKHIQEVQRLLNRVIVDLLERSEEHDQSKLVSPEVEVFDEYTEKLRGLTYGSDEYKHYLSLLKPALDHHYKNNKHHPEAWENGIQDMTLIDIIEMLVDWVAASKRHLDGDIYRSIEVGQKRFGYSDELKGIFKNTIEYMEGWE